MIPLRDNIPTLRFPLVTALLIALNVVVFAWQLSFPAEADLNVVGDSGIDQSSVRYGAIPYRLTHPGDGDCFIGAVTRDGEAAIVCEGSDRFEKAQRFAERAPGLAPIPLDQPPWYVTVFSSMFMHGGILHIAFNMLFLWIFGNNVEDRMGRLRFLFFYLLAGIAAVYAQSVVDPESTVPTIGASGAVAGVLGGYALLFPRARVMTLIILVIFLTFVELPALLVLGIWFALQFIPAVGQFATPDVAGGGVAYMAHVGGFVFGLLMIKLFVAGRGPPARTP